MWVKTGTVLSHNLLDRSSLFQGIELNTRVELSLTAPTREVFVLSSCHVSALFSEPACGP